MSTPYTENQLFEKFRTLPDDIRQSFVSFDTLDVLGKITGKYKLHIDQGGALSEQVGLLMLGVTRPRDFLANIQTALNIPIETAGEIVKEVNDKIFFPIRQSLKEIHNLAEGKDTIERSETAPKVENFAPEGDVSAKNIPAHVEPLPVPDNNAIIISINDGGAIHPREDRPATEGSIPAKPASVLPGESIKTIPTVSPDQKLFDQKMGKLFHVPKEEVTITPLKEASPEQKANQPADDDPYRELPQ